MVKEEFKDFMDRQISEIERYLKMKSHEVKDIDYNACVFEWIKNNAVKFRKRWGK